MIAPLAKLMDWSAFQAVALMMPSDFMQPPRLEEALEFLKGPEFIPDKSQPARIELDLDESGMHFRFPSPRPGNCAENNKYCLWPALPLRRAMAGTGRDHPIAWVE
jgi:hypothetical protein